jgi:hypothetical protein
MLRLKINGVTKKEVNTDTNVNKFTTSTADKPSQKVSIHVSMRIFLEEGDAITLDTADLFPTGNQLKSASESGRMTITKVPMYD